MSHLNRTNTVSNTYQRFATTVPEHSDHASNITQYFPSTRPNDASNIPIPYQQIPTSKSYVTHTKTELEAFNDHTKHVTKNNIAPCHQEVPITVTKHYKYGPKPRQHHTKACQCQSKDLPERCQHWATTIRNRSRIIPTISPKQTNTYLNLYQIIQTKCQI